MPDAPIMSDADPLEGDQLVAEITAESGDALDAALARSSARRPATPTASEPAVSPDGLPDISVEDDSPPATPKGEPEEKVPANLKDPGQVANWKTLRAEVKASKAAADAVARERDEWKAKAETKADPEEVSKLQTERDQLADQLAYFALEKSPAFSAQFDTPIATAEKTVFDSLKAAGASEEQLIKLKEADGVKAFDLAYWDRVSAQLKGKKDTEAQGLKIESAIRDVRRLAADRAEALKDPEKRKAFQSKSFEEWKKRQEDDETFVEGFVKEIRARHDWANPKEIPPTATPAEKAALEAHNRNFNLYQDVFTKAIVSDDVAVRAKIGLAAVTAYRLQDQNKALKETIAALEKRGLDIESAGRVTRPSVAPGRKVPGTSASPEVEPIDGLGSSRDSLDGLLEKHLRSARK